ncbi:GNAT family N-acetyltransferase [Aquisalinus flavus]|uniref:N-acetyltransferase domain-containing protein n=1 Tax=Aquisalinus flavus TaxID=1526572 RepID=A0A8J2V3A0_9PROT|nr:GNAT family N-acetyltransferase [Aquisalinus flavus]MBD0426140.1 GNAT family N-acetyltransferase [Aquisalinus flavus]UNE48279.1 GNAT family N-acetyltransferase [Aquisalinus flavus]GGD10295.1 hypothetical protein GCM10011342_18990 [Aquisalinus flavus]
MKIDADAAALLAAIPDTPRHVEARSCLIAGTADLLYWQDQPFAYALINRNTGTLFVHGAPRDEVILEWAKDAAKLEMELVGDEAHAGALKALLPGWEYYPAILFRLAGAVAAPGEGETVWLSLNDIRTVKMPEVVRDEILVGAVDGRVACSLEKGRPVSFCYAGAITEALFDIGIDTLAGFRRKGHARRAAALMISDMSARGLAPVWGAVEENIASIRVAEKLGFEPVDSCNVFALPD